ncbi:hypothetical protein QJ854_gp143 [Moumouvirus goulette]|uniref:Uncharacterized protein n=1 Tax=Moumouvirus goulette TaxID=1247379 RepID=M1PCE0_9VIRU|nr:hypothetical protein QJ854_gp143 [Moumouvirus goulette]AGF85639.1 hypothetical protein glt_00834 [Moumouvirus goulette]
MECYYCETNKNNICFYYGLKPIVYLESKHYNPQIHKNYKPICGDCVIEFILKRQQGFKVCEMCQCYYLRNYHYTNYQEEDNNLCDNCHENCDKSSDTMTIKEFNRKLECSLCKVNIRKLKSKNNDNSWARIINSKTFSYGLSGSYILTNGQFNTTGCICQNCLKKYEFEPYLSVECNKCKNRFQSCVPDSTTQGLNCASTVYDTYIIGFYGSSKYDEEKILFVTERPKNIGYRWTLCDSCITDLIKSDICLPPKSWNYDNDKNSKYVSFPISNPMNLKKID